MSIEITSFNKIVKATYTQELPVRLHLLFLPNRHDFFTETAC